MAKCMFMALNLMDFYNNLLSCVCYVPNNHSKSLKLNYFIILLTLYYIVSIMRGAVIYYED